MVDLGVPAQFAATLVVGVASGIGSAWLTNRRNDARYTAQRLDTLIPAARRAGSFYLRYGESLMNICRTGPDMDAMTEATRRLDEYRHDLPPGIQQRFRHLRPDTNLDQFDTGDVMWALGKELLDWADEVSEDPGAELRRLRRRG